MCSYNPGVGSRLSRALHKHNKQKREYAKWRAIYDDMEVRERRDVQEQITWLIINTNAEYGPVVHFGTMEPRR